MHSSRRQAATGRIALATLVVGQLLGYRASAQDMDTVLRGLREQAAAIEQTTDAKPIPEWLKGADPTADATVQQFLDTLPTSQQQIEPCRDLGQLCNEPSIHAEAAQDFPSQVQEQPTTSAQSQLHALVFVSRSLGDEGLKDIFETAGRRSDTRVIFCGIDEGESLMDFIASLHALVDTTLPATASPPDVSLDPEACLRHDIRLAPTIVILDEQERAIARVAGLTDPQWLIARVRLSTDDEQIGDLGVRGNVRGISEPNLLDEIKRRIAALDMHALGERVVDDYFTKLPLAGLTTASQHRTRRIDPTLVAEQDIRTPAGTLIVRRGDTTNPLDHVPFTLKLIVFDAADPRQVEIARDRAAVADGLRSLFLITGLNQARGWEEWESLEDQLDAPIYLLTPDLLARFALERVPSIVTADGREFVVEEIDPGDAIHATTSITAREAQEPADE